MESALRTGADAPGLKLIETMLWDGAAIARRHLHMARLARSAAALGWAVPDAVVAAVAAVAHTGPARVRLTLDRAGAFDLQLAGLPQAKPVWAVALAPQRLQSADPWLRVKTTRRALYDTARAGLEPGIDEVLFLNERDEVCEGTITSVFFDRGRGMRCPPLNCGLLPGVLRADLACVEEVLRAEDLGKVRLWVGNALRGLVPVDWRG